MSAVSALAPLVDQQAVAETPGVSIKLYIMNALTQNPQPLSPVELARSWRGDVH